MPALTTDDRRLTTPLLLLGSTSPRRALLLREAGYEFTVASPPFADPDQPDHDTHDDPAGYAATLALQKLHSFPPEVFNHQAVVLTADTLCVDDAGRLIGKPRNRDDARDILRSMIGRSHRVVTSVAIRHGAHEQTLGDTTVVHWGMVPDEAIETYLRSDGWVGKAGGYNLADRQAAGWPITVEGDPATVMGLPMNRLVGVLAGYGITARIPS